MERNIRVFLSQNLGDRDKFVSDNPVQARILHHKWGGAQSGILPESNMRAIPNREGAKMEKEFLGLHHAIPKM